MPTYFLEQLWVLSLLGFTTSQVLPSHPPAHSNSPPPDSVFLSAAMALSDMVTEKDLSVGRLYPPLGDIREISVKIATKVAMEAYQENTASTYPEPEVRNLTTVQTPD